MKHSKLKVKLLEPAMIALADDEARKAALIAQVQVKKAIQVHDIQEYLILTDDLELIESGTSTACKRANRALQLFTQFDIAHKTKGAAIETKLNTILNGLVADADLQFTDSDKANILAMGFESKSWAEQNGYNPLRIGYFDKARAENGN